MGSLAEHVDLVDAVAGALGGPFGAVCPDGAPPEVVVAAAVSVVKALADGGWDVVRSEPDR